ncbi:MAG: glycosyltransferase, partial [Halofilum sp. (in: g-proteobacteria)]
AALSTLYWGGVRARLNRWTLGAVNRHLLRSATAVVAISPRMQALAVAAGRADSRLLSTQLAPDFIQAPVTAPAPRLERILYVGRLAAEKRIARIIEAAERLPQRQFRVAGDGPLRGAVERAAVRLNNLEYLGWLPRDGVRDALDAHDLLLLPSAVEAFGTVVLEALARGRIALASAGCGIHGWPELAAGVYRFEEDEHPARAIERLAALPGLERRRAAYQGREAALAMHGRALAEWRAVLGEAPAVERAA